MDKHVNTKTAVRYTLRPFTGPPHPGLLKSKPKHGVLPVHKLLSAGLPSCGRHVAGLALGAWTHQQSQLL